MSYFLEIAGTKIEFSPKNLTITTYIYDEFVEVVVVKTIDDLRKQYRELLIEGYKKYDPNEIVGTKSILENTLEQEAIIQAEIEAMEREEFFTAKPDDWASK
ncbi:hypothetical protein ALT761_02574 [Alteromonas sp. 76-1]|jgi:hypothetical protein|uniref:hypothetical protein n=1 Tax=Alteromonas sp. 76-1 TaxID=2358187 RepID=UPI000FD183F1|nr:hypothetical protein [Alteromonas sp. 76-1]VEL97570.1 hypothetical protein ALT761_02574 [Alteromonas sp. 76-1]